MGTTVTDCHVPPSLAEGGGAIVSEGSVDLTDSVITGNSAGLGGGINSGFTSASASLSVTGSSIAGNSAVVGGGGIMIQRGSLSLVDSSVSGNTAGAGGGLATLGGPSVGALLITGSTWSGNTASETGGTRGGGIRNAATSLTLRNSILTGNTGGASSNSGGLVLENSTFSGNTASSATALYRVFQQPGTETLRNTILAGTCSAGLRTSQGGNLESPGNGCGLAHASDQVNLSAATLHLGALGAHGGPTPTLPLLSPSAAIDAGVACPPPTTDQRGVARPQGAGCDAGAFELEFAVPLGGVGWLALLLAASGSLALRRARRAALA